MYISFFIGLGLLLLAELIGKWIVWSNKKYYDGISVNPNPIFGEKGHTKESKIEQYIQNDTDWYVVNVLIVLGGIITILSLIIILLSWLDWVIWTILPNGIVGLNH